MYKYIFLVYLYVLDTHEDQLANLYQIPNYFLLEVLDLLKWNPKGPVYPSRT